MWSFILDQPKGEPNMPKKRSTAGPYKVGYACPPDQYKFKPGQITNPTGINRKSPRSPDLKASLERELTKPVRIKRGKRTLVVTQEAAGTSEMVRQFVKGDARARRDLFQLCDKYGINLSSRNALQGALEEALSAEDEALLADFVRRHGGQYSIRADASTGFPAKGETRLDPPVDGTKLQAQSENPTELQTINRRKSDE
jgi:hypothetical protein